MFNSESANDFLKNLETLLEEQGIDLCSYFVDHLCYRVPTEERYLELKEILGKEHTLLHEAMISNRPIATYKLSSPIKYKNLEIPLLELPSPKPGSSYEEGYEHAEAVIDESFEDYSNKYPHIDFDWKGAKKEHNPELRIKFGNISIKFHHLSLEEVIKIELSQ